MELNVTPQYLVEHEMNSVQRNHRQPVDRRPEQYQLAPGFQRLMELLENVDDLLRREMLHHAEIVDAVEVFAQRTQVKNIADDGFDARVARSIKRHGVG